MTTLRARLPPMPAMVAGVAVAALIGLLLYGLKTSGPSRTIDDAIARGGRPSAPTLALPALDGGPTVSLDAYRGRVVVLNYWASWCTPCRQETPLLERWHRRISGRGGTVLGIDGVDATPDARAFIREFRLTYPILRDGDGHTESRFGITGYPETLVIDRRGRIAALQRGPVDDAFLRRTVLPLLAGSA